MTYLNDILIYSYFLYEYRGYIKIILEYLKNTSLFQDITKYKFYIIKVIYLRFIISIYSTKIDLVKIKIILK